MYLTREAVIIKMKKDKERDASVKKSREKYRNFFSKIVCVIFAVILWMYVNKVDSEDYKYTFENIPVNIINTSALESERSLTIYSGYNYEVDIVVSGRKSIVEKYTDEDVQISADVSSIKEAGEHNIELNVKLPGDIVLSSLSKSSVVVYADIKETVNVEVKPKIVSVKYDDTLEIGVPVPETPYISVTGPRAILKSIDYAEICLTLGEINKTVNTINEIKLVNNLNEYIDTRYLVVSRTEMNVTVPVIAEKTVNLEPDFVYGYYNDTNSSISLNPSNIKIKGDPVAIQNLDTIKLDPIDEKTILGDTVLNLKLPENEIYEYTEEGDSVSVEIKHKNTTTKTFEVKNIELANAGKLDCRILTEAVNVTLRGTASRLSSLGDGENITLVVDMKDYKQQQGTFSAKANVRIPGSSSSGIYELGEYNVSVEVK